jgi:hypothetical protein
MKTFNEWLNERKMVPLYHGTTTGNEDQNLRSFRDKGIKPLSASGHGQGAGYFSFSDAPTAARHAMSLLGPNSPKTFQMHSGKPMVVAHQAELNPKDYELDAEVQKDDIFAFLKSNRAIVDDVLAKNPVSIEAEKLKTMAVPVTVHGMVWVPKLNGLAFWIRPEGERSGSQVDDGKTNIFFGEGRWSVDDAADFNAVVASIFERDPKIQKRYKSFVRSIMKRTAEGRAKHRAWKYVGDKAIKPSRIRVGDSSSGWQDA